MTHPAPAPAYFEGVFTALVTPFRDGAVDEAAVVRVVERQIAAGVAGLVPGGTTGETATLTHDEKLRLTELCISTAAGRVPVIAGCGSNDTSEAIELARHAKRVGADGALVVTPYYNRPSQEGLYAHYAALNAAVELPVLIYNVPGRTSVDISTETVARLSKLPNVIGVKDATGDVARATWMRKTCADGFVLLSGDDPSTLGYIAHGGHGVVSVTSNVAPAACVEVVTAALGGDFAAARAGQDRLIPLHRALFADASPGPAKFALCELGLCAEDLRLPLVACGEAARDQVRAAMADAGVTA